MKYVFIFSISDPAAYTKISAERMAGPFIMKKTIGFILFWIGIGIFITLFLPQDHLFIRIILSAVLILCGYQCFFNC